MGRFYLIIIATLLILLLVIFFNMLKYYKKCPPGHVMVIINNRGDSFGNRLKFIYAGGAFVWPIFGGYQLFNLSPFTISSKLTQLLTADNNKLDIELKVILAVSSNEMLLENAVDRISGLPQEKITTLAEDILSSLIRFTIISLKSGEIKQSTAFHEMLSNKIENEIGSIGLKLINLDIIDIKIMNYINN